MDREREMERYGADAGQVEDAAQAGEVLEFGISPVQLLMGLSALGMGAAGFYLVPGAQGYVMGALALFYGFRWILAYLNGRIVIEDDALRIVLPGSAGVGPVPLAQVMQVERRGGGLALHLAGEARPRILPGWILRADEVDRLQEVLATRITGTEAAEGADATG